MREPWETEVVPVEFESHGLPCRIYRLEHSGVLAGMVGVPKRHALYGNDKARWDFDAHCGVDWVGESARIPDHWCFAFDCGHDMDYAPRRSEQYCGGYHRYMELGSVRLITENLARQISEWPNHRKDEP